MDREKRRPKAEPDPEFAPVAVPCFAARGVTAAAAAPSPECGDTTAIEAVVVVFIVSAKLIRKPPIWPEFFLIWATPGCCSEGPRSDASFCCCVNRPGDRAGDIIIIILCPRVIIVGLPLRLRLLFM